MPHLVKMSPTTQVLFNFDSYFFLMLIQDIMSVDPPVLDENDHIPEATGAPNRCASQDATSGQNESDDASPI